jgi:hypothetical protein
LIYDPSDTIIKEDKKRPDCQRTNLTFTEEEIVKYLEEGKKDWLVSLIMSYLNYCETEEGIKETEEALANKLFDNLTNKWYANFNLIKDTYNNADNDLFTSLNSPVGTNYFNPNYEIRQNCGSFNNVLTLLGKYLSEAGFEMDFDYSDHSTKSDPYYRIIATERDYILDKKTGIAKIITPNS